MDGTRQDPYGYANLFEEKFIVKNAIHFNRQ